MLNHPEIKEFGVGDLTGIFIPDHIELPDPGCDGLLTCRPPMLCPTDCGTPYITWVEVGLDIPVAFLADWIKELAKITGPTVAPTLDPDKKPNLPKLAVIARRDIGFDEFMEHLRG